jgi:putative transposase
VFSLAGRSEAMKASKLTDAQKAFVFKQGEEGVPVAEVCRKAGISQATYFAWKKKYAGLMPSEMRRLKQLEEENSRLKRIVADLSLDKEMLQDIVRRKLRGLVASVSSSTRRVQSGRCRSHAPARSSAP